ncbi:MAG: YigZ family protein [Candidatus Kapabacteria bacterium]|nr:YigZ family protein [Ignavibacteriota bacterium]MCW5885221.1 YigZ family protein [Candidatus Kapabacteria bacterium]
MSDTKIIDKYYTIAEPANAEIKIKGSAFIANAFHASDINSAGETVKEIRAKYFDASHNCFAYRIGFDGNEYRASDDGEPSGTAGKPILFMINKYELSDILVVVTRYFGGTKLGVGGLVRAYSDSAEAVLQIVNRKIIHRTRKFYIRLNYEDVSMVKKLIERQAVSFDENYTDVVEFTVNILLSEADKFIGLIYSQTNGRIEPVEI